MKRKHCKGGAQRMKFWHRIFRSGPCPACGKMVMARQNGRPYPHVAGAPKIGAWWEDADEKTQAVSS